MCSHKPTNWSAESNSNHSKKKKNKNGTLSYKVMIRAQDGFPPAYKTLPSFQEAKEWAILEEAKRKQGTYSPEIARKQQTLSHLIDSYIENILPLSLGSARGRTETFELVEKETWKLATKPSNFANHCRMSKRTCPNSYRQGDTSLPFHHKSIHRIDFCCIELWSERTRLDIRKSLPPSFLNSKNHLARDRILTQEECNRLLQVCSSNTNKLLYPIVLLALTTGARCGEILSFDLELHRS
jgi:integrase